MSNVKLTQMSCLKHFWPIPESAPNVIDDDEYLEKMAIENHQERLGTGSVNTNTNTLYVVSQDVFNQLVDGSYADIPTLAGYPADGQEVSVEIQLEDIDAIITTRKQGMGYNCDIERTINSNARFLARFSANEDAWEIVHFFAD